MAVENLITEHLDIWTSAIKTKSAAGRGSSKKLELVGIKKLRELILELAVRGKLVPQDPNDEPASELLKKIEVKKNRLMLESKLKKQKQKPLPPIAEEEKPFESPRGWEWVRLGAVTEIVRGITFPSSEKSRIPEIGRVACLRTTNVQDQIEWDDLLYIGDQYVKREDQYVLKNDIVMSMANSRELVGKVAIISEAPDLKTSFGGFLGVIRPINLNASFVMCLLRVPTNRDLLIGSASQTTNIANISLAKLNPMVFSVPPLAEQNRIAAKVDELMALCDQLVAQTESSIDAHKTLVEVLLATLTDVKDADELNDSWQTISQHFDVLFTTQASIDQLKQTILQLAVMGKLVKQDPLDEPASKLLERIATEKQQLIKDGKIKKQKPLPPISDEEKPFELPVGWGWCRFYELFCNLKYGTSKKSEYKGTGTPILRIPNVVKGFIDSEDLKFTPLTAVEVNDLSLKKDDILIIRSNGSTSIVGSSAVVDDAHVGFAYAGYLVRVRLPKNFNNSKFIHLVLKSVLIRSQIENPLRTTSGVKNINSIEISRLILPIIPLEEQNRIVVKVNELMALCDSLKVSLNQAQTTQIHLTDAIVEQAL
jgi:type I restriction enzyme S subunit